jgi:beta-glucosidase-like glycosyl hydrolase
VRVSLGSSYNALNGKPTCADPGLLDGLARDTFGFTGYITGDCGAADGVWSAHHFTSTPEEAAAASMAAGMDVDCGHFVRDHLAGALSNASVPVDDAQLDASVAHLFAVRVRLGEFDPPSHDPRGFKALRPADVDTAAHNALALRAAVEGIVLLENTDGGDGAAALPLDGSERSIALVGPVT